MSDLASPAATLAVLRKHNLTLRKKYGQNFLVDRNILEKIVAAASLAPDDCVLEIGPGIGTMTALLAARAGQVVAVEIDRLLIPVLAETLADYSNITVLNADIMKTNIDCIGQPTRQNSPTPPGNPAQATKVVANLPYYITTPVIMKLLERKPPFASLTLTVQREVAERMQAAPGTKDYGALSLAVQYYAKAEVAATIPPTCFIPLPKVESSLLVLTPYENPPVSVTDEGHLFAVIRAAFGQRRKTLANALSHLVPAKETVVNALKEMNLPAAIRGEALSLAEFAEISNKLVDSNG
jgi:16S rRNA (adenine1518-N6/adenine1519-N6)-dimethyltransferase